MIDFFKELNPEQLEVVLKGDGPCLVLAGAGSGKTRTITYRVAYLLEQGVKPENILLVTFTNKAAKEMKERVRQLADRKSKIGNLKSEISKDLPWSGTFHHIAYRILKQYSSVLGYANNFSVLDSEDSQALIRVALKNSRPVDEKNFPSAAVLHSLISFGRNAEISIEEVLDRKYPAWSRYADIIKQIAGDYETKKKQANAMDFDDLLVNLLALLSLAPGGSHPPSRGDDPLITASQAGSRYGGTGGSSDSPLEGGAPTKALGGVLAKFAAQFQYVLVDEYQDTNKIQASIIKKFSSVHHNILVVGDDAQSIYSFRAADIQNILRFEKDYPRLSGGQAATKIFKLQINYRSSREILDLANNVIANNPSQYEKNLKSPDRRGDKPLIQPQLDQSGEAQFVAQKISELLTAGTPAKEIAVLFRAAHHSQVLEMELTKNSIAYEYRGGVRFFERAHVKDILAYLRLLNNLADTAAWLRVLQHEEGIGPAAAGRAIEAVRSLVAVETLRATSLQRENEDVSSVETHCNASLQQQIANIGAQVLGGKAQAGWNNFLRIWDALLNAPDHTPKFLIEALRQSAYVDYLESEFVDSRERLADLEQLNNFSEPYESLEEFLAEVSLQESFVLANPPPPRPSGELSDTNNHKSEIINHKSKIILSTVHQAKGLEWSEVFIINLGAGAFPNDRALRENNGIEEERRLFYVAITRAKNNLYLTYPMAGGRFGDLLSGPSMFISEIDPDLVEDHSLLSTDSSVFNDEIADVQYIDETPKIKPGSFLRSLEDL